MQPGDRVFVDIDYDHHWSELGTVTHVDGDMATVELDELIEVPAHLGGGFMRVVDREVDTLEPTDILHPFDAAIADLVRLRDDLERPLTPGPPSN